MMDLCAKHSWKNLAMTLGSCKAKKEDMVGAGPQKVAVNLSLIEWRVTVVDNFFFSPPGLPITVLAQLQLRTALATFTITATCYCGAVMMTYSNI